MPDSSMNILEQIVEVKKVEIAALLAETNVTEGITAKSATNTPLFYRRLARARALGRPFFISEFKRKSPSEGWINEHANLTEQVLHYRQMGASAISVLTDAAFFGGSYADLQQARQILDSFPVDERPLLLQKDFILDPVQLVHAKQAGADLILLIAAILPADRLDYLRNYAEQLGLGVLVEVHDAAELAAIQHLDFPVLGVNNRDLKTFRTALNRVNVLRKMTHERFIIAESGVLDEGHFQVVRGADGFLIGTGLMRSSNLLESGSFEQYFQAKGRLLFKACGIRNADSVQPFAPSYLPDYIGLNFSPRSKRRVDEATCRAIFENAELKHKAVAVFYQNTPEDIREVLSRYPFMTVQLYADDVSIEFARSLRQRILLAVRVEEHLDMELVEAWAAEVDCFILDGAMPGSGQRIAAEIPHDFPYPFLLAGGMNENNLELLLWHRQCIGVDMASGIETDGMVDTQKIEHIGQQMSALEAYSISST